MPDLVGQKLDVAYDKAADAGLDKDSIEILGGGTFGVVVEGNWTVCSQTPAAGQEIAKSATLSVERSCAEGTEPTDTETPSPTQSAAPTPTQAPPTAKAVRISVDALFDKLNAGGTKVGDRFRITGVLTGSQYWGVGASGDFSVLIEAKGGTNDLMIFIDEAKTASWRDGTRVEFVVEDSEVTIGGETSGGWLRAVSAKRL